MNRKPNWRMAINRGIAIKKGRRKGGGWIRLAGASGSLLVALAYAAGTTNAASFAADAQAAKPVGQTPSKPAQAPGGDGAATGWGVPALPANLIYPISLRYIAWNASLMQADIQINGSLEHCVLDTGLNANLVTPDAAARWKAVPLTSQRTISALNDTRAVPETDLKNLQINLLKLDSLRAGVADAGELYTGTAQPDAPGLWLGTPFLSAFQVTFDYAGSVIVLDKRDAPLPKDKNAAIVPLELRDGRLYARVSIPRAGTFTALVDTGAMGTLIPGAIAAKLKITPTQTFAVKRGSDKQAKASLITLPAIQVGKMEQQQVPALYFEPEGSSEGDRSLAVLGSDFLSRYKVVISFAQKKMVLIPPTKAKPTDPDAEPDAEPPKPVPKPKPKKK